MLLQPEVKKYDDMCIHLGTVPPLDGRKDGRTELIKQYRQ